MLLILQHPENEIKSNLVCGRACANLVRVGGWGFSGREGVRSRDQIQMNSKLETAASFAKNFCPKENPQRNKFDYITLEENKFYYKSRGL